jgi:hypothetical protein
VADSNRAPSTAAVQVAFDAVADPFAAGDDHLGANDGRQSLSTKPAIRPAAMMMAARAL